jgi:hypothetical protein
MRNPIILGHDGELYLVTTQEEMSRDETDPSTCLYNVLTGETSEPQPLQVFFKWGNFSPTDKTADEVLTLPKEIE